MKRLTLLLFAALTLVACSDDDKDDNTLRYDETNGYLTNLVSAEHGLQDGVWLSTSSNEHTRFGTDGIEYSGASPSSLNMMAKYEVYEKSKSYILRTYYIGDIEGVGKYTESTLTTLNKEYFCHKTEGKEYQYKKITE